MPRLHIDLSEAQSNKPLPDGIYSAAVDSFSDVQEGPKAKYVTVGFVLTEGGHEGRKFFNNYPIEGKGAGMFADLISKLTGEDIDVDDIDELDIDTDDLIGSPCALVLKQEEYPEGSNDFRSKIAKVLAAK